jgi:hypothetical protein
MTVEAVVSIGREPIGIGSGEVGSPIRVAIPDARLWGPDDPFLYDLQVSLTGAEGGDRVASYFGMRSISYGIVDGVVRPLLNGQFVFQIGTLDQGFWPDGLYTAPTDEAVRFDLQAQKDLGFNTVRKHLKVEPARWYHWADRLGMLVWQDMPSLPVFPPQRGVAPPPGAGRQNFENELHRLITQLRGWTCIVQWQPFNEEWAAYDRTRIAALVNEWDPTRPVDIDSGGTDDGAGDRVDDHVYPGPEPDRGQPPLRAPTATRVAVIGEYGALGLVVPGHEWQAGAGGPGPGWMARDSSALTDAYVRRTQRLRRLMTDPGTSAAIYTQITDVENECNGLWTYDRLVLKVKAERVRAASLAVRSAAAEASSRELKRRLHGRGGTSLG